MKIFVVGSTGLVGRNFLEHPEAAKHEITAPARPAYDLFDYQCVLSEMKKHRPDAVVHCAGRVGGIQANMREPVRFLVENWQMGNNLVLAAREAGVRKLLNLGSSCMYPRNAANPLTEDMVLAGELEPTNEGYALAKIAVARLCEYIRRETPEFHYKTLIPCNLYGRWDHFEPERSHMVPAVIHKLHQAVKSGTKEVSIWGDGESRREFLYTSDLADFMFFALARLEDMPDYVNVGLGRDYTINEYYRAIADVVGYGGAFTHDLDKPSGMRQKLVDVSRQTALGWSPPTSLEQGIEKTWRFYLEHVVGRG